MKKILFFRLSPVGQFLIVFTGLITLFYLFTATPWFAQGLKHYLSWNAHLAAFWLQALGYPVEVVATSITSAEFSVNIRRGCDAIEPIALLICAILAFPVLPLRLKWPALIFGSLSLFVLNLVRIISLFLVGVYVPQAFNLMHVQIWQTAFIVLAILAFILWLLWALPRKAY